MGIFAQQTNTLSGMIKNCHKEDTRNLDGVAEDLNREFYFENARLASKATEKVFTEVNKEELFKYNCTYRSLGNDGPVIVNFSISDVINKFVG